MEKIAMGVWIRLQRMDRRLWFEVNNNDIEKEKFDRTCRMIDQIATVNDWKNFLETIDQLFREQGFWRISK